MKLWRCENPDCTDPGQVRPQHDYANDTGVCDRCGADPRTPEGKVLVGKREVIHLLVADKAGPILTGAGRRHMACEPAAKKVRDRITVEPVATTCPACIASDDYKKLVDDPDLIDDGEKLFKRIAKEQLTG